jgi:hypothetical protein
MEGRSFCLERREGNWSDLGLIRLREWFKKKVQVCCFGGNV